jgi:uncharacterized RDD family membrane protein YckC
MGIDIERMNYVRYRPLGQFMQTSATFVMFLLLNARSLATRGQTWGKRMARTRIVSNDGKLLPLSRLILRRYVPYFFMGCIPLAGVILVWADMLAIFRRNHKCLHDELAGTKVVKVGFVGR